MTTQGAVIAARRARYEALRASGTAPKTLPGPSARPASPVSEEAVLHRETIPGGWYCTTALKAGETLRLQTTVTASAVSLLAWRRDDASERLNTADTIKVQWTAALGRGRVIFSDMGRVMLSIVDDSCEAHDALVGGSTHTSNARRHPDSTTRNTRDNFLLAAAKLGLTARDIPPCLAFFAPLRVGADGRFVWAEEGRTPGDYVDLRAEMDLLIALSNCPHPFDPAPGSLPAAVDVIRFRSAQPGTNDLCRTATDEARRGFSNNAALVL